MKRDRSNLSRDELGLLLSVCEQKAEEEIKRLKERMAVAERAAKSAVRRCVEPLCTAVGIYDGSLHYFDCHTLVRCAHLGPCKSFCDKHVDGKLSMRVVVCAEHSVSYAHRHGKLCKECLPVYPIESCGCKWGPYVYQKEGSK
jgi:hypothetical protein